jgi:hypothetical protein
MGSGCMAALEAETYPEEHALDAIKPVFVPSRYPVAMIQDPLFLHRHSTQPSIE